MVTIIRLIMWSIAALGVFIIYRLALKAWRRADVQDKLEKIDGDARLSAQISTVDEEDVRENRDNLDKFKKL